MKMRLIVLAVMSVSFKSWATDLITAPESSLYLAPPTYTGNYSNILGDNSVPSPNWYIAQWTNPNPLPAGPDFTAFPATDWEVGNDTTNVKFYHAPVSSQGILEHTYELAQNGNAAAHPLTCGKEFDLFLSANNGSTYRTSTGAIAPSRFAGSGPLGSINNLIFRFGLNINYEQNAGTCSLNYVGYLASVTLSSVNGQSMFYQVYLRTSRGSSVANQGCPGYSDNIHYCYDITIDQLTGQAQQQPQTGRVAYNFNFLPRLNAAIKMTSDPNLANWHVTGAYVGELLQGGMMVASRWDNITLTAY